jgi:hypothetical protein
VSEVIASHAMPGLEVSDHGLDRSTPLKLALHGTAFLAVALICL